jgi:hypothetical protein
MATYAPATVSLHGIATPGRQFGNYARNQVRSILSQPPFRPRSLPRPFAGILHTVSSWLHDVFGTPAHWVHESFYHVAIYFGISSTDLWLILGGITFTVVAGITALYIRRKAKLGSEKLLGNKGSADVSRDDPGKLKKMAQEAEDRGDYTMAVRLRFRAGLAMLEQMGIIHSQMVHTNNYISAAIHSSVFSRLAQTFDEAVYGGLAASLDNAREADTGWIAVLQEASLNDSLIQDNKIAIEYNIYDQHSPRYRHRTPAQSR